MHLINEAWFRNLLPHLCGLGPYERLLKIAQEYGIDPGQARNMTRDKWKEHVKKVIRAAAEEHMANALAARGLPRPEPQMKAVPMCESEAAKHNTEYNTDGHSYETTTPS
jgi:hypothetical protein